MPEGQPHEAASALLTERCLFPDSRLLDPSEMKGSAKALLVRSTAQPVTARVAVRLHPVAGDDDWEEYAQHRVLVEDGFGVDQHTALKMVDVLRADAAHLALGLHLAVDGHQVVGAIGRFRLPGSSWARLQEVDVFPGSRGKGYGDAVLAAMVDLLAGEGSTVVVVGADEDDWPCSWCRRRGFREVAIGSSVVRRESVEDMR